MAQQINHAFHVRAEQKDDIRKQVNRVIVKPLKDN